MLGSSTDLSRMKSIQLGTLVNEMKESLNDAEVKERTMKLEMEKEAVVRESKNWKADFDRSRNHWNKLVHEMLNWRRKRNWNDTHNFEISGNTITRTGVDDRHWSTTLFEERISEGVVAKSVSLFGKCSDSEEGLMFGLVDAQSEKIGERDQLGDDVPNSIALAPKNGKLHTNCHPLNKKDKHIIFLPVSAGDKVVLEVDMDARPRTAVFIVNGNVPLTFVSGLPPSIRFGLSMKNKGVSIRFDGMSGLKRATPLRRVNEIKWNPEDLRDSDDMYMNGLRSSVLTVETVVYRTIWEPH
ncbi:hypothetical protein BLNAU_24898 [Blattamonas nauphoetae]|uniref:Uncharacterized protein n=1 Tax=Blattamonas nauphoetae TaxID=2049346 RepID=A0ABQ9WL59_9EUKA|nr:hypothetical protein BLNAU_24898 [Blattamonas nauphoetae]